MRHFKANTEEPRWKAHIHIDHKWPKMHVRGKEKENYPKIEMSVLYL